MTGATIDHVFREEWEALEYHRFFWGRCKGDVLLQAVRIDHGMFEHAGSTIFEYDRERVETESYYAYVMLHAWFGRIQGGHTVRLHFSEKSEAALFKLTFGGA